VGGDGSSCVANGRLPAVEGVRHGGGSVVGSGCVGKRVLCNVVSCFGECV
jgi:hypothetical protein